MGRLVSGGQLAVTGTTFVGREQELYLLDEAWCSTSKEDKINIVSLIGQGGEGKSALVLNWLGRPARHGWQGARRVFEWSFYSQGTSDHTGASADEFFNAAFVWFGPAVEVPRDPWAKGAKLAELVAAERTLLVLDGIEPLQHPPGGYGGEFKDLAMKSLLRGLARHNPGLCVLTSRIDITDLSAFENASGSCRRHRLDSLDAAAARALLRELDVLGPNEELDEAAAWCTHHAYNLNLLGNFIGKCTTDQDICGWEQRFPLLEEDEKVHDKPDRDGRRMGHGRRMLKAYECWLERPVGWRKWLPTWLGGIRHSPSPALAILRLLGLFDRPVRSDLLDELRAVPIIPDLTRSLFDGMLGPLDDSAWLSALDQLERLALVRREPLSIPAGTAEVELVSVSAHEISDELIDAELEDASLPEQVKSMPRAALKQLIAQIRAAEINRFAKPSERPRRAVTFVLDTHPLLREHLVTAYHRSARWLRERTE